MLQNKNEDLGLKSTLANAINTSFHTGCNNVFIYLRVVKLCDILG